MPHRETAYWYLTPAGWQRGTIEVDGVEQFAEPPAERAAIVQVTLVHGHGEPSCLSLFRDEAVAPPLEELFGARPPVLASVPLLAQAPGNGVIAATSAQAGEREAIALAVRCWLWAPLLAYCAGALAFSFTPDILLAEASKHGARPGGAGNVLGFGVEVATTLFEGLGALADSLFWVGAVSIVVFIVVFVALLLLFIGIHQRIPGVTPWSLASPAVLLGGAAYIVFGAPVVGTLLAVFFLPLAVLAPFLPLATISWWMNRDRALLGPALRPA